MSSILDANTSLETMRVSNEDVLALIGNLKEFLTSINPVTFKMGSYTITVDSVRNLVDNYRNGKFDTITIGGQTTSGKQVKLSVNSSGDLLVTDSSGSLVSIDASSIRASFISNSTINKVVANDCEIRSIKGKTSVSGGVLRADQQTVNKMVATTLSGSAMSVTNLQAMGDINCNSILCYGTRKLRIRNERNVFYRGYTILDNMEAPIAANLSNMVWNVSAANGSPADLGFDGVPHSLPEMIRIQGMNVYSHFTIIKPVNIQACYNNTYYDISTYTYEFPALVLWPTGYIDYSSNRLVLTPFSSHDAGKDMYYMTFGEPWTIYRTMIFYNGSVTFGCPYTIPAYSCIRFIADTRSDSTVVMSVLEIA